MEFKSSEIEHIDVDVTCSNRDCFHSVLIKFAPEDEVFKFERIFGQEILRLLVIAKSRKRLLKKHFMPFLQEKWEVQTLRLHAEKTPIKLRDSNGTWITILYPEKVPALPIFSFCKSRKGNEWLAKHGVIWEPNISVNEAKKMFLLKKEDN